MEKLGGWLLGEWERAESTDGLLNVLGAEYCNTWLLQRGHMNFERGCRLLLNEPTWAVAKGWGSSDGIVIAWLMSKTC